VLVLSNTIYIYLYISIYIYIYIDIYIYIYVCVCVCVCTLCGHNVEFFNFKSRAADNHCAPKGQIQGTFSYNYVLRVNVFNLTCCTQYELLSVVAIIILKYVLMKGNGMAWAGFI
jgi:fatty acid desaturase